MKFRIVVVALSLALTGCASTSGGGDEALPPGGAKSPLVQLPATLSPADAQRVCAEVLGSAKDVTSYLGLNLKDPTWSHGMGGTSFWQSSDTPGEGEPHPPGFRCDLNDGAEKVLLAMVVSPPDGDGYFSATSQGGQVEAYVRDVSDDRAKGSLFDATDAKKRAAISKWLKQAADAAS